MSDQPEALRLADVLDYGVYDAQMARNMDRAATELRRLHAEVERLRAQVADFHAMWKVNTEGFAAKEAEVEKLREALVSSLPTVGMGWIERAEKAEAEVERLRAELARLTKLPSPPPLWGKGCPVCGIGNQPGVYGVVCARGDCPTRVTYTGAV